MNTSTYTRYELLRAFRNRRYVVFSLAVPIVLYVMIAAPNRHEHDLAGTGISAPLYYMVGLASWGTMTAVLAIGGRIAAERSAGWNRQLRITPLTVRAYFRAKLVTGYALALVSLALLYVAGASLGVSLSAGEWLTMTALILLGLIPFAGIGVFLGHLLTADSAGPAIGISTAILAVLGGTWFPITNGVLKDVAEALPSYWLVQASHVSVGGHAWGATGWLVVAGWSVAMSILAGRAYERDTTRA